MFTHIDENNQPKMVDVGNKEVTRRQAKARSIVVAPDSVMKHFNNGDISTKKGPVFKRP